MAADLGVDPDKAKAYSDIAVKIATDVELTAEEQKTAESNPVIQTVAQELNSEYDPANPGKSAKTYAMAASAAKNEVGKSYAAAQSNPDVTTVERGSAELIKTGILTKDTAVKWGAFLNNALMGQDTTLDGLREAKIIVEKNGKYVLSTGDAGKAFAAVAAKMGISIEAGMSATEVVSALNSKAATMRSTAAAQADLSRANTMMANAAANPTAQVGGINESNTQTPEGSGGSGTLQVETGGLRTDTEMGSAGGASDGAQRSVSRGTESMGGVRREAFEADLRPISTVAEALNLTTEQENELAESFDGIIPGDELTEEQIDLREKLTRAGFGTVLFAVKKEGGFGSAATLETYNEDTNTLGYAAIIGVNGKFLPEQYAEHEKLHLWLRSIRATKELLFEYAHQVFGSKDNQLLLYYAGAYANVYAGGFVEINSVADLYEHYPMLVCQILEEMLCDAYAGMSKYGYDYADFQNKAIELIASEGIEDVAVNGATDAPVLSKTTANPDFVSNYDADASEDLDSVSTPAQAETETEATKTQTETEAKAEEGNGSETKTANRLTRAIRAQRITLTIYSQQTKELKRMEKFVTVLRGCLSESGLWETYPEEVPIEEIERERARWEKVFGTTTQNEAAQTSDSADTSAASEGSEQ